MELLRGEAEVVSDSLACFWDLFISTGLSHPILI